MAARRHNTFLIAVAAVLYFSLSAQSQTDPAQSSNTFVISIGVSRYPRLPGGRQLQFAEHDAVEFAEAMRRSGVPAQNVRSLIGNEATLAAVKSAIGNWLARSATERSNVVIFFSGHGFVERSYGESYLFCHDSDANDPFATSLSVSDLDVALTRRIRARKVILIADAVRRDLFPPDGDGPASATTFAESLDQLSALRPGLSVILASGPGEFSREGQRWGGHGVFARFLLDSLQGGADLNRDGAITVDEMFDFVLRKVSEDTSNKQHPWRSQTQVGEVVIAQSPLVARNSATPQAPPSGKKTEPPAARPAPASEDKPTVAISPGNQPPSRPAATSPARPQSDDTRPSAESKPKSAPPAETRKQQVEPEIIARTEPPKASTPAAPPAEKEPPKSEPVPEKRSSQPAAEAPRSSPPAPPRAAPIKTRPVESRTPAPEVKSEIETDPLPPPPKPPLRAPEATTVTTSQPASGPAPAALPAPAISAGSAPSPLILQIELAISSGSLIEPRAASAWDLYQRLSQDTAAAAEVARLKPRLAEALANAGRKVIEGDVRSDNIADKIDEFKRAGQMFSRARSLMPENPTLAILEKISAAQALLALQFYDEAERSLKALPESQMASVENALGLVYQGKLDTYRAERAFKRAIEMDDKWVTPHYNLALLYRAQKNDAALDELTKAAELASDSAVILGALGDECFNREKWQQAVDAFKRAIALSPEDDTLYTRLGHALFSLGQREEADRAYKKANELRRRQ